MITVSVGEETYEKFSRVAESTDSAPEDLLRLYVEYVAAGGPPLEDSGPTGLDIARLISRSSAWEWLKDEPDLYTMDHGEPV